MNQQLEHWPIDRLIAYDRNPRKNDHAVDKVASAIKEYGFRVPVVAKSDGLVVDGHLRLKAAKKLNLETVPVLLADDLTDAQIKAFRLSVNRVAQEAQWDNDLLKIELTDLDAKGFDLTLTGFDVGELTALFDDATESAEPKDLSDQAERFEVIIECGDEGEQERAYNHAQAGGFECRISTF